MKNTLKTTLALCTLYFVLATTNAQVTFEKTFGGNGDEVGSCIRQTFDGGYVLMGYTTSYGAGGKDILLMKTDSLGNQLWSKAIGGAGNDFEWTDSSPNFEICSDGGFIICSSTNSYGQQSDFDIYVIKTDDNGNIEWTKTYNDTLNDYSSSIKQTVDGGFIIASASSLLMKIDSLGNIQWNYQYDNVSYIGEIDICSNGDIIFAGGGSYNGTGMYISRVSSTGNPIWTRSFNNTGVGYSIKELSNGNIVMTGYKVPFYSPFIISCNANGSFNWAKEYKNGTPAFLYSLIETNDNNIAFTGAQAIAGGKSILTKIDVNGNPLWSKSYLMDSINIDVTYSLIQTSDNGFSLCGKTGTDGMQKVFIIKTDELGNINCSDSTIFTTDSSYSHTIDTINLTVINRVLLIDSGVVVNTPNVSDSTLCYEVKGCMDSTATNYNPNATVDDGSCIIDGLGKSSNTYNGINLFPNPSNYELNISISNSNIKTKNLKLLLYTEEGKRFEHFVGNKSKLQLNKEQIPLGIYFYNLVNEDGIVQSGKIILK